MKLKLIACGIAGVFALSTANAEHHEKGVVEDPITVDDSIGATLSAGYMSKYVFYGLDIGEHGLWTSVDYTLDLLPIPIDVGAWYINTVDPSEYDELDLYAGAALPGVAGFDPYLSFIAYLAPQNAFEETYELNLALSRSLGVADWAVSAHYDFVLEAWYFETGLSKGVGITDAIEVVVSAGIAYSIDYFSPGSNWNHVFVQADLPIALTDSAKLTPYVAGVFSLDALDAVQDDFIHGGVSLSVSF